MRPYTSSRASRHASMHAAVAAVMAQSAQRARAERPLGSLHQSRALAPQPCHAHVDLSSYAVKLKTPRSSMSTAPGVNRGNRGSLGGAFRWVLLWPFLWVPCRLCATSLDDSELHSDSVCFPSSGELPLSSTKKPQPLALGFFHAHSPRLPATSSRPAGPSREISFSPALPRESRPHAC